MMVYKSGKTYLEDWDAWDSIRSLVDRAPCSTRAQAWERLL